LLRKEDGGLVRKVMSVAGVLFLPCLGCTGSNEGPAEFGAALVAHRGASAYAPEHTLAAYELAIDQGADFIEPDLQITRDGVLVALHDFTLERTTDVQVRFPNRFREMPAGDSTRRVWPVADFTLEEVKSLDAGSWFGEEFAGAKVPTFSEVIQLARGRAGLYPETKAPSTHADLGFAMERLVVEELRQHGLEHAGADPSTPVVIQSFSDESLRLLRTEYNSDLPMTFLLGGGGTGEWLSDSGLARVREFATGIGPARRLLDEDPTLVTRAQAAGLTVTPYTFGTSAGVSPEELRKQMTHALCALGVDGLFTNNPDLFPREGCR
jgi:glycerophosphoryl diester phosphodiesterase